MVTADVGHDPTTQFIWTLFYWGCYVILKYIGISRGILKGQVVGKSQGLVKGLVLVKGLFLKGFSLPEGLYNYPAHACASKGLCDRSWRLYIVYCI